MKLPSRYLRYLLTGILLLILLGWSKGYLHYLGREIGSANSEIAKELYLVESSFNPKLITHVNTNKEKLVALTFDDGPDPTYTPEALAILKKYHVKATFFVVGQSAEKYPALIEQEIAAGNEVENHTYTHPSLNKSNGLQTEEEMLRCQQVIINLTGKRPHYFRPPRGLFTNETIDIAELNNYRVVLWTICVEHHRSKTPAKMAERVIDAAKPGTIILAHDGRLNRTATMQALPEIIEGYQAQGYRFVTLNELLTQSKK